MVKSMNDKLNEMERSAAAEVEEIYAPVSRIRSSIRGSVRGSVKGSARATPLDPIYSTASQAGRYET